MSKDFGAVSSYLDPTNRAWEQVTWRTGRTPLDREFNLAGELFLRHLYRSGQICSGFIFSRDYFSPDVFPVGTTGDYVEEPGNYRNALPSASAVANTLYFGPRQVAHVADMLVNLSSSAAEWLAITLNAAPAGVAVKRWDFVFLEVWRAPITGDAATDVTNGVRDTNQKIFYNGWVDSPTGDNFSDDVLDVGKGVETSRRVQIQWRIRVVDGVDPYTYPDPLDDTATIKAQGPEASPTTITYANQAGVGDPGLWLSTGHTVPVDGNVYAIPICCVARRNTNAWAKDTNQNGGSGRPDGLSHEDVAERDVFDMRKTVSNNWDFAALLKANIAWLFDGKLKTDFEDHGLGGGERGTWYTQADEIGPTDTAGATQVDIPDGWKQDYSDAVVSNEHYQVIALADRTVAGDPGFWAAGDEFEVALPVASDGILENVSELVLFSGYDTPHFEVSGLNSKTLTITLTANLDTSIVVGERTGVDLWVKAGVVYPGNAGLSHTPHEYEESLDASGSMTVLAAGDNVVLETSVPAGVTGFDATSKFFKPSRSVTVRFSTTNTNFNVDSLSTTTTAVPYNVVSVTGIYDAVADPGKSTNLFVSLSGNVITHSVVPATHRAMIVDFVSRDPLTATDQVTLYYRTAAQQTLNVGASGLNVTDAKLHVLYAPDWVYTMTAGSGSHQPGYPWVSPSALIPVSDSTLSAGDHLFDLNQPVSVDDFGTDAQLIRLPVHVPLAHIPFFRFGTAGTDSEGRHYYEAVQTTPYDDEIDGTPTIYQPSVFAKKLQGEHPHKVVYPCIAMCMEDTNLGKRGTLLLLIFTRSSTDDQNAVVFTSAAGDSCVGVYRLKGNPIASPRKYQLGLTLIEV